MATRKTPTSGNGASRRSSPLAPRRAAKTPRTAAPHSAQGAAAEGLGTRLRHARMVQQLTLKALAEQAGCSESLLSKVEGGHATPSLATLHRIALALDTNIAALVSGPVANVTPVQRASERPSVRFPGVQQTSGRHGRAGGSIMLERLVVAGPGQLLQGDIHVLEPLARSDEQISHAGEELGYVLEGELELTLGSECYRLQAGDSFYFPSTEPHSYRNPGDCITRVLWINTPPTF
ncbi:UNVERIFIED_ORG: XRE family transcriptional regulator [Burkholderia sp. CF145]|uniref:cupin domain-containing protein n=1 Tax=Paraburkholderia hospita TaxID=169430 RepID=UPI0009A5F091|nr:cupin domain-containing protein [Paraburkholderia hospita]SKD03526.1 transcriptional regulator, XRE family with cupin sensor [Paraburkholderia hospita]